MACMSLSMKCAVAAKPVARKIAAKKTVISKAVVAKAPVSKKVALSAAVTTLATNALPALAVVDERLNGDGTGLIFGINDESLGFILLTVPVLVFSLFYASQKDAFIKSGGADDDSGLSL